ncbi:MAG: branched-chain amino acid transporter [Clostridiales bacterium]|nr:branched-chain amino acid transporter [Clostridiales bacterium]
MAAVSFLIRVLPLTLIRRPVRNRFIRSFLYYVPYVTLSVMTVPAMIEATGSPLAGGLALLCGVFAAWKGAKLLPVALICCAVALLTQLIL